ncbi:MAG: DUF2167 domain-containing protein [Sphingomonas sp.]
MRVRFGASAMALALVLAAGTAQPLAAKEESKVAAVDKAAAIPPELLALEKGLHPLKGDVSIPGAKAVLHLGEDYYFLSAAEAKRVLIEVWRNPPEAVSGVLGMVLEKDATIFDNVWGAVVTYMDTGHVSDGDAAGQDYGQVLKDLQAGEEADNEQRKAAGYPKLELVGWAQPPSYDAKAHSLIWARELAGEGDPVHGLNYDVRLLGRTGVLSLNMVSSMDALGDVRAAAAAFGESVTFEPGSTYADFNPSNDRVADYGLAGLVAGGAAVAVAQKVGLLAILFKFGKFILIGLAALGAGILGLFRRRREKGEEGEDETA